MLLLGDCYHFLQLSPGFRKHLGPAGHRPRACFTIPPLLSLHIDGLVMSSCRSTDNDQPQGKRKLSVPPLYVFDLQSNRAEDQTVSKKPNLQRWYYRDHGPNVSIRASSYYHHIAGHRHHSLNFHIGIDV
ncbi:unnamed protein product [Pleuronectes platessa]|uniref:Uncharacterized protein n=1 Tax=Pleuronectes platessa TaxID=8262 RepID=A0A9N7UVW4_PLEPL|nr:unnamed protein product [Pleuronectes platessa]